CPLIYRSFIVHLSGFIYRGQYRRTYLYRSLRYSLSIDINVVKGYYESGLSRLVIIYCYFTIALLRIAILSIRAGRIIENPYRTDYRFFASFRLSARRFVLLEIRTDDLAELINDISVFRDARAE